MMILTYVGYTLLGLVVFVLYSILGNVLARAYLKAALDLAGVKRNVFTFVCYPIITLFESDNAIYERIKFANSESAFFISKAKLPEKISHIGNDPIKVEDANNKYRGFMTFLWPVVVVQSLLGITVITAGAPVVGVIAGVVYGLIYLFKGVEKIVWFTGRIPEILPYTPAYIKSLFAHKIVDKEKQNEHPYRCSKILGKQ